jgi:hypothetical protein
MAHPYFHMNQRMKSMMMPMAGHQPTAMMNLGNGANAITPLVAQRAAGMMNMGTNGTTMMPMFANFGPATFRMSPFNPLFGPLGPSARFNSPYPTMNPYPGNMGTGGSGYAGGRSGSGGGNGGGGYGGGGGSGAGNSYVMPQSTDWSGQLGKTAATGANLLDTLGLPNEGGQLAWPLALRVMAPAQEVQQVRAQVDGLLQLAALQAGSSSVAPGVLKEMDQAVARLRHFLRTNADGLPEATQTDARRFLTRLSRAVRTLPSFGSSGATGTPPSPNAVGSGSY